MAIDKIKDGATYEKNVQEFVCDSASDLELILENLGPIPNGSRAFVIEEKTWYVKGTNGFIIQGKEMI